MSETKKLAERLEEFYTYFGAVAEDAEANHISANAPDYREAIALVKELEGHLRTPAPIANPAFRWDDVLTDKDYE